MNDKRETIKDGIVGICDDRISLVSSRKKAQYSLTADTVIDAKGKLLLPGFVNLHSHLQESLMKGLGDDRVLLDWLTEMESPCESVFTPHDNYVSALLSCSEMMKTGVTTVLEQMCVQGRKTSKLGDATIKAMLETGIRGTFGRGWQDTNQDCDVDERTLENTKGVIADVERLIKTYHNKQDGMIKVCPAPAQIYTSTEDSLLASRELANKYKTGLTIHVAETKAEVELLEAKRGKRDVDYLDGLGFLGPDVVANHCNWVNAGEIRKFSVCDVKVSHNPVSNMYLASGVAPIPLMVQSGIMVGIGTDGAASNNNQNMVNAMKLAALLHKVNQLDATVMTAEKVVEMATIDGARSLGLGREIGSVEEGKKSDLILIDLPGNLSSTPTHNFASAIVYQCYGNEVDTSIINGKIVMANRKLFTVDESTVIKEANEAASKVVERAGVKHLKDRPWKSMTH